MGAPVPDPAVWLGNGVSASHGLSSSSNGIASETAKSGTKGPVPRHGTMPSFTSWVFTAGALSTAGGNFFARVERDIKTSFMGFAYIYSRALY